MSHALISCFNKKNVINICLKLQAPKVDTNVPKTIFLLTNELYDKTSLRLN